MPILVELVSPDGAVVQRLDDPEDVLHGTLPYYDDATFRLLSKIDWYGDTEIDGTQVPLLLEELERIMSRATGPEQVKYLHELKQIAIRCSAMADCKLIFLGD